MTGDRADGAVPDVVTAAHDRWDATLAPARIVQTGGVVTLACTMGGARFRDRDEMLMGIATGAGDGDSMPLSGPIAIEGMGAGDAVRVDVLEVALDDWGYTRVGPGMGLLEDATIADEIICWDLRDGHHAMPDIASLGTLGVAVPIAPFAGVIGVAPAGPARGTRAPGDFGGNLDVRKLVAGSSLWLRAEVDGGLVSIGDLHAAQGSGEVGGTAIETSGEVTVRLSIDRDANVEQPRFITPTPHPAGRDAALCTTGIGPDLMFASQEALADMVAEVARLTGAPRGPALALCSVAADLAIEEIVDAPNWVVSCCLPLAVLGSARPDGF